MFVVARQLVGDSYFVTDQVVKDVGSGQRGEGVCVSCMVAKCRVAESSETRGKGGNVVLVS
jgi:hypothetical protein